MPAGAERGTRSSALCTSRNAAPTASEGSASSAARSQAARTRHPRTGASRRTGRGVSPPAGDETTSRSPGWARAAQGPARPSSPCTTKSMVSSSPSTARTVYVRVDGKVVGRQRSRAERPGRTGGSRPSSGFAKVILTYAFRVRAVAERRQIRPSSAHAHQVRTQPPGIHDLEDVLGARSARGTIGHGDSSHAVSPRRVRRRAPRRRSRRRRGRTGSMPAPPRCSSR